MTKVLVAVTAFIEHAWTLPHVGRHWRAVMRGFAEMASVAVGEKHGSDAEFSAAATVVEVRA
jgi:hypothetical protein